jgi:hypothetical protein
LHHRDRDAHDPTVQSDRPAPRNPVAAAIVAVWNYLPTLALGIIGAVVVMYLLGLVDWFGL